MLVSLVWLRRLPVCQEATTTTAAETEEHGEPKEKEAVPKEDADQDKEKETPATEEAAGELPASTPASVAWYPYTIALGHLHPIIT